MWITLCDEIIDNQPHYPAALKSRRLELEQDRVSRLGDLPMGPTISSKQMPVNELKEFVDYVKARPMRELR